MRATTGRNAPAGQELAALADEGLLVSAVGRPQDQEREAAYDERYGQLRGEIDQRLADLIPPDADVQSVADKIARVIALPTQQRPFRTHVDPSRDGSEVVSAVADRIRAEFYRRVGIEDLLSSSAAL
jgi:hypothetical protein